MCLGIPGEVVELLGEDLATVAVNGVKRDISIGLLDGVKVGDWVLVHVGFALSAIDEAEATETLDQIKKLGRVWDEELDAFKETAIR
ncbi:MAG: HypC/HybG/HupF family hydrogenase formation chaperone [Propionibacteriaceae bacterium]|jgi:hydrogenase expression/formation protein HypC|nr:HypC/HybG/HupF family hydrogenase formation chaperone [Propionibacteriaceae bacterium]